MSNEWQTAGREQARRAQSSSAFISGERAMPWRWTADAQECFFFFQAEDGIRDLTVTGVQTCALPIYLPERERGGCAAQRRPDPEHHREWPELLRNLPCRPLAAPEPRPSRRSRADRGRRSEERRVGKECRSRWSPYH